MLLGVVGRVRLIVRRELLARMNNSLTKLPGSSGPGLQVAQAFLQDPLVQFDFRDDLLQARILLLQATQLRQLRLPHPPEPLALVVIRRLADPHATTGRRYVAAHCQLQLNLAQKLQYILVRRRFPSH